MTTPVKPPMGDRLLSAVEELAQSDRKEPAAAVGTKTIESPEEVAISDIPSATGAAAGASVEQVIGGLKSRTIDVDQAVQLLVERAIEQATLFGNTPVATRKELQALFRNALDEDPALLALVRELRSLSQ
jgi:hypothetical protein